MFTKIETTGDFLGSYDYSLPKSLIALAPKSPRDFSKLLVYDTASDKVYTDRFYNLSQYLPEKSFLVLNDTKVVPSRVILKKETGGKVVVMLLVNEKTGDGLIKAMVDRKVNLGTKLYLDEKRFFLVCDQKNNVFLLKYNSSHKDLFKCLQVLGHMPIPLYLRKTKLSEAELRKKYQTIFAHTQGSVAAPTASLHFTDRVFHKIEQKGIRRYEVTLHVGMGTFAPIEKNNLLTKKLHEEYFEIKSGSLQCFKTLKSQGWKLVAVGTTVTRTLESLSSKSQAASYKKITDPNSQTIMGKTDLFIFPPYDFEMVDCLITNFHLPGSSLMMLVEAFLQHKSAKKHLVDLYGFAIKNKFRFYSFGDAMLII
ncbi:tRNA preQ1(34) S-adenosylmethionine ribosyltransferase-isomerase QueA [Candidatus Roizmanbacteria bacterium]|nr:tRNA preQ1(34) S-adenosylmethionine ribosyltransferase-isomerase QueA [Candidatus Roizmanbacteria bacterium]